MLENKDFYTFIVGKYGVKLKFNLKWYFRLYCIKGNHTFCAHGLGFLIFIEW